MVIRIYFEGGKHLKEGFQRFFEEIHNLARSRRGRILPVRCRDRASAVRDFMIGLAKYPSEYVVLLIDCEGPAEDCSLPKLRAELSSVWNRPVSEGRVFRMTQVMESWFLADRSALREVYGPAFDERALPGDTQNVERIPKQDVLRGLKAATRLAGRGAYEKGHANEILRRLNPELVQAASPECGRMFTQLRDALSRT